MRVAAGKIAEDLIALFGLMPSRYVCSPMRRSINANLELAEVNNDSNENRRYPPVEDCFAVAKPHTVLCASRKCQDPLEKLTDISPEKDNVEHAASCSSRADDIIEENIHDLTKMLDPKYIIDRTHVIDSNHNIDKIRNLKYLLDPTFNKIRHLRRLNHKRINSKNFPLISEPKFISYQNLKSDGPHSSRRFFQLNALSDPMLSTDTPGVETKDFDEAMCRGNGQRRNSNLSSMSDSNLKSATTHTCDANIKPFPTSGSGDEDHGYSVQNLNHGFEGALARHAIMLYRQIEEQRRASKTTSPHPRPKFRGFGRVSPNLKLKLKTSPASSSSAPNSALPSSEASTPRRSASPSVPHVTITPNKLANLINLDPPSSRGASAHHRADLTARNVMQTRKNLDVLRHSESINTIDPHRVILLEPCNLMDTLMVPTIHSEPPSPIEPLPAASLQNEETQSLEIPRDVAIDIATQRAKSPLGKRSSPVRHSDPVIPTVLLNIEDYSEPSEQQNDNNQSHDLPSSNTPMLEPIDLFEALLKNSDKGRDVRLPDPIFAEHDSTRFSSRRPSDSKWSESSRSQEILSSVTERDLTFPSSYSVNDFQTCNSSSDLNDVTSLDPFMCPDALSSSLRESFFSAPSVPDSDIFTSFEDSDGAPVLTPDVFTPDSERDNSSAYNSMSTVNLRRCVIEAALQSRSTESVHRAGYPSTRSCAILRLEPEVHSSKLRVRHCGNYILKDPPVKRNPQLAPLAIPTPTDICTPTFDVVSEIKSDNGVGVRV
ncbi:uncharacterized protein LOC109852885 [Pseudomyrmex gracilis]|uniref:uncharacterized protein LOC109852885 n=1 Tax=Pseudomyrmex gracilis TaxID=219809 RepID=UPI0009954F9F|nr:uncharacterized protein LOC109852885 [Pseudomyrmex gracilis]